MRKHLPFADKRVSTNYSLPRKITDKITVVAVQKGLSDSRLVSAILAKYLGIKL